MKKFILFICLLGVFLPAFADNVNEQKLKKMFAELALSHIPRGIDIKHWYGYDMPIELAHENFIEGTGRGVLNVPANFVKKSAGEATTNKVKKDTVRTNFSNLTWNYGKMGDNRGENKAGVFVGTVIGFLLLFFSVWLIFSKKEEKQVLGWVLLLVVFVLPFSYKILSTDTSDNISDKANQETYLNDTKKPQNVFEDYVNKRYQQLLNNVPPEAQKYITEFAEYTNSKLNQILQNMTPEQELYFEQNVDLFGEAEYLNGYLIGYENSIKWCYTYYPVDNFRFQYNSYFGTVKEKVRLTLVGFIGESGVSELDNFYTKDEMLQKFYNLQQEAVYIASKPIMRIETKEQYCKIRNDLAKDVMQKGYERLKNRLPNFFD